MTETLPLALRAQLFAHLAALEQAGVPVAGALQSLVVPAPWQRALGSLRRLVEQGGDLASAGRRSGLFSPLEVTLLAAAQQAGSPERLYRRLAEQYEWQLRQRKALLARLYLPGATLLLALLIQPLPALVGGSLSLFGYLWSVLQPLLGLALLLWAGRWLLGPAGQGLLAERAGLARQCDGLPLLGAWLRRRASRDFCASLGLLLEAGVAPFEALPLARASLRHAALVQPLVEAERLLQQGASLSQALAGVPFADMAELRARLVAGEGSGLLGEALLVQARRQGEALAGQQEQLALWLPRLVYLLLALWIAWGLISGPGLAPSAPLE